MEFFLFQIFPYVAVVTFVIGSVVRFNRDPYSWRSKSSQLLRRRQLVLGSTLFHIGVITIIVGHTIGLLTPIIIFDYIGISHSIKQMIAIYLGGTAGLVCLTGLVLLLHRRLFDPRIFATSSVLDIGVLVVLLMQLCLGLYSLFESLNHLDGREMVKFMNWAQYIVTFQRGADLFISDVALVFKLHIVLGLILLFIWPFTRLVHVFSMPLEYLFRPYQIVRKRGIR